MNPPKEPAIAMTIKSIRLPNGDCVIKSGLAIAAVWSNRQNGRYKMFILWSFLRLEILDL